MMNFSKHPIFEPLFFLVLFSLFKLKPCTGNNGITVVDSCPEIEKQSLLSFKHSLHNPENSLSSWNHDEVDCCKWEGVRCNNLTGHVEQLHLQNSDFSGKVSPSLLNLKHLKYLDLSQNLFYETIPSFIGSLTSLEYLDLSFAEFHGKIPHNIGNLSNLHTLSFDSSYSLQVDSLEWLSGLSKLEYLNMNGVNLSRASNWAQQVINKLPSLVELQLSGCSLNLTDHLDDVNNITTSKLVNLDLSGNQFINSSIPEWLYLFKGLEYLNLKSNNLQNAISNSIANLTSLMTLDLSDNGLSGNGLSGNIPRGIGNMCKLQKLYLGWNKLQGGVSDLLGNVSACFLGSLEYLQLTDNQLSGPLAHQFGEFKRLRYLSLSGNSLSGVIPSNLGNLSSSLEELDLSYNEFTGNLPGSIGKLSNLQTLHIENNKFTGNLPESIGQLSNLQTLHIYNNQLEGVVTETHFANLSRLEQLVASGNNLTLKVNPNWIPPFKLSGLYLGSWNLGCPIMLPWLDTQKTSIDELDLSNTGIYGNVPTWLWSIQHLDLSHNQLDGNISFMSTGPARLRGESVYLGSNRFSGELPRVGTRLTILDLSNNSFSGDLSEFLCNTTTTNALQYIHLDGNHLTGELPNCFMKWSSLFKLHLGNNNLSGRIPNSIRFLAGLQSLNLNGNNFSGHIPLSMRNCTELAKMDLSHNNLSGNLPKLILKSLTELVILILKSNKLSGRITPSICQLNTLQILDLSDNMFYGTIPTCVDNFTAMATKRSIVGGLSYLTLVGPFIESASMSTKGMELTYDTILLLVKGIDLSRNNLSGSIPESITSLVELRMLNLSRNHLTGPIPRSIGNMTQLESLDFSINSLSGDLPTSFTSMSSFNYLNVSYNNLTGRIPESTQLRGFNESSFIGNSLCGFPLTIPCTNINDGKAPAAGDEESDKKEIEWLYVFISLGYGVGLSGFLSTLYLKRSWWEAYCQLLDKIWDDAYVYILIKWTRLAKARASASGPNM